MHNDNTTSNDGTIKVWDLFIRLFHWTLVASFATAYISGEFFASEIHVLVGYALCVLLIARIYWGFKGSRHAQFRSFFFPPGETLAYVRSMLTGHPKHYLGHNPAGALMVFTLLCMMAALLATGLATLAAIDYEGPLLFIADSVSDETAYTFRHLHELLADIALTLVSLHIVGAMLGSIQHRENLVKAMFTGKKLAPSIPENQNKEH
ncbi:MAG: cytochrome b/b6 domain-containing protein [Gallionella sp.]